MADLHSAGTKSELMKFGILSFLFFLSYPQSEGPVVTVYCSVTTILYLFSNRLSGETFPALAV